MKTFLSIIIFTLCAVLQAQGQTTSQETILKEISLAASQMTTLQCDFVQTKYMKMLGNELIAKGKMYCSQPDKLRWEYISPYTYSFVLYQDKVMLKKGQKTDVFDVQRHKIFKEIAAIMMSSVLGNCFSDKSFKVSFESLGDQYVATLLPLKKEMKIMFTHIVLHYNRTQSMVNMVQLYENNGDHTTIELKNARKNELIHDEIFKVE